uniref:Uncharacterized protein n=1 Tax=Romanomermis culicivorax TaxID=13658 RepID=A0A915I5L6_ROMCU
MIAPSEKAVVDLGSLYSSVVGDQVRWPSLKEGISHSEVVCLHPVQDATAVIVAVPETMATMVLVTAIPCRSDMPVEIAYYG